MPHRQKAGHRELKPFNDLLVSGVVAAGRTHGVIGLTGVAHLTTTAATSSTPPSTTTTTTTSRPTSRLLALGKGIQDVSLIVELDGDEFPALISKLSELMSSEIVQNAVLPAHHGKILRTVLGWAAAHPLSSAAPFNRAHATGSAV